MLSIVTGLAVCALCAAQSADTASFVEEGVASWYGTEFEGRPTASGEIFRVSLFTAAHPTLPFGTTLRVTNRNNNRSVIVRVNDRGPFVSARIIDLSKSAAEQLDMIKTGTAPVVVERLDSAAPAQAAAVPEQPAAPVFAQTQVQSTVQVQAQPQAVLVPAQPQARILADEQPAAPVYYLDAPKAPETYSITPPAPAYPAQTGASPGRTAPTPAKPAVLKGAVPGENGAKLYRIQVGSYIQPRNAVEAFEKLKNAGLNPAYEKYNDYYRVVLSGVRNTEVKAVAEKLGQAGFEEALIKEEN